MAWVKGGNTVPLKIEMSTLKELFLSNDPHLTLVWCAARRCRTLYPWSFYLANTLLYGSQSTILQTLYINTFCIHFDKDDDAIMWR